MSTDTTDTSALAALCRAIEALTAAVEALTEDVRRLGNAGGVDHPRAIAVNDVQVANTPAIGSAALHAALDAVERHGRTVPHLSVIEGGQPESGQP